MKYSLESTLQNGNHIVRIKARRKAIQESIHSIFTRLPFAGLAVSDMNLIKTILHPIMKKKKIFDNSTTELGVVLHH